jgi:AcrR family transcriptional regulator
MGSNERREREKQGVRQKILDAARELFVQQGYEAVTMRQIAQKIEYTPTAIYFHFKDKEDMLRELCSADFLRFAGVFQHLGQIRDPLERLVKMARAYMEFGLNNPNQYRFMFMTPHPHIRPEDVMMKKGNPAEDAYAFLRTTVAECFIAGVIRPEYKDPEIVAQMLWSTIHGVTSLNIAMGTDDWVQWRPVKDIAETMLQTEIRGLTCKDAGQHVENIFRLTGPATSSKNKISLVKKQASEKRKGKTRG